MKRFTSILFIILCTLFGAGALSADSRSEQIVAPPSAETDRFAYSIAIDGNWMVVGADYTNVGANEIQGAVYVYERDAGQGIRLALRANPDG